MDLPAFRHRNRRDRDGDTERKRHLLRLWLAATGARPLPPVYAERYGSTTVGDRGGIICPDTRLHAPLEPV